MFLKWLPTWAWKLIYRHFFLRKSRMAARWMNVFACLGIAVGVFAWTSIVSIMSGLQDDMRANILAEKPHILWEGRPERDLDQYQDKLREVLGTDLKSIKWILQTEGLLEVVGDKQRGRITGSGVVVQGMDNLGDETLGGLELLRLLRLKTGDSFKLHSAWRIDLPPLNLRFSDVFHSGVYEVDRSAIRVDRLRLESWLGLENAVSRIEIQLHDPMRADKIIPSLKTAVPIAFKSWTETDRALWYSLKLEKLVLTLAMFFIVVVATLAVHLALSVRVAEKSREIALLRALGAEDHILSRLYLSEGSFLGVAGAAIGLIGGWLFCKLVSNFAQLPAIYYDTSIPVNWNWGLNIALASIAVILGIFASWLPAQKVKKIEIQEALRS